MIIFQENKIFAVYRKEDFVMTEKMD